MARILLAAVALFLTVIVVARADDAGSPTNAAPAKPPAADASALTTAPNNDVGIGSDGAIKDQDSYQARIGELYAPDGEAYIMPVRLPALAKGQQFATVHLRFQLVGLNNEANGLANADLYGLGVRDSNKALPTDYYQGAKPDSKATLLQGSFLTPASKVRTDANTGPFVETSAAGDAALAKYFNDACAKPENAGKYVFLRISYDADPIPAGNNAYMLLTTGATGDNEPPVVTYTLTPAK
ncbi:MAG TPA: hypothetical protein VGC39_11015 [Candidatus Methylacidiphilales bacterium]